MLKIDLDILVTILSCLVVIINYVNMKYFLQVPMASDDVSAKRHVSALLETLGYHVSDLGALVRARDIENIPLSLFPSWRRPLALSLSIWIILYLLTFSR